VSLCEAAGVDADTAAALVEESAKRSGLIWVGAPSEGSPARPVWHVWQDGMAYVLTGGIEQPRPAGVADGGQADVTARSKDKGSRLVVWRADVVVVPPGSPEWDAVVPALQSKRLNSPDGDRAPTRWASECELLRLRPTGEMVETPDAPSTSSHATGPLPSAATTPVPRPWHLFGRSRRRRSQ
jgi:hypothetical protein